MDSVCCCFRMPLLKEGEESRRGLTVAGSVLVLELLLSYALQAGCLLWRCSGSALLGFASYAYAVVTFALVCT